jgi:hypothetical protein
LSDIKATFVDPGVAMVKLSMPRFQNGDERMNVTGRMRVGSVLALVLCAITSSAAIQSLSPTQTAIEFYKALKAKKYIEGFRHSVYRRAVQGLSAQELLELEPDFARTFSQIPDKIEPRDEKISGESALVLLQFEGTQDLQQVGLMRLNGEWLVGDKETLELVNEQGNAFFFNARMAVNESEAYEMLQRIIGAEVIYSKKFEGRTATLEELIKLGGVPKELESGVSGGYRFGLTLRPDKSAFYATAVPESYGKTGRISLYADFNGIRGADLKGKAAGPETPVYQPR